MMLPTSVCCHGGPANAARPKMRRKPPLDPEDLRLRDNSEVARTIKSVALHSHHAIDFKVASAWLPCSDGWRVGWEPHRPYTGQRPWSLRRIPAFRNLRRCLDNLSTNPKAGIDSPGAIEATMCQGVETYHIYAGCKLIQQPSTDAEAARLSGEQDDHDEPANDETTFFSRILPPILTGSSPNKEKGKENASAEPAVVEEAQPHKVKITTILQCPKARGDVALGKAQDERRCTTLEASLDPGEVEELGITRMRGECPVCKKMEDIQREALNVEIVVRDALFFA